jgi:transposase
MEQVQLNTKIAGIDVAKAELVVAVHGLEDMVTVANNEAGVASLIGWLKARGVCRVGLEATGRYERLVWLGLGEAGLDVVMHQPMEVTCYRKVRRWKAKNDKSDARLIAAATAHVETVRAMKDPRLVELADRMTAYEQVSDEVARFKTFLEHPGPKDIALLMRRQLASLERLKLKLAKNVEAAIQACPDLAQRYELLRSITGVGPIVASSLVACLPELGSIEPGEAAALLGVAPFDRDSGVFRGQRRISGGRRRPRRMVFLAATSAMRHDPYFKAFAERLRAKGKKPKVVIIAVARKLIEAANLVLARGEPWVRHQTA